MAMGQHHAAQRSVVRVGEQIAPRATAAVEKDLTLGSVDQIARTSALDRRGHTGRAEHGDGEAHEAARSPDFGHGRCSTRPNSGPRKRRPSSPNISRSLEAMKRWTAGSVEVFKRSSLFNLANTSFAVTSALDTSTTLSPMTYWIIPDRSG